MLTPDDGPPPPSDTGRLRNPARQNRRSRSGRFATLNAFVDFALSELTGAETKVWLILFRDSKAATGTARTGQTDIARRAGLSSVRSSWPRTHCERRDCFE